MFEKGDRRLDLGTHAPLRELALGQVTARLGDGEPVQEALVRLPEMNGHPLDPRRQDQERDPQAVRQQRRGQVLVDHRLDALVAGLPRLHDGDPAAAGRDHHESAGDEGPDLLRLHDPQRMGRGDDAPIAAARVLDHLPALVLTLGVGLFRAVGGADRLGGLAEGRIVAVDHHVGQDAGHCVAQAAPAELVEERVAQDVADAALRVGDTHVEREARDPRGLPDQLGPQQDEADLRAIPVCDHDPPPVCDERGDVAGRLGGVRELLGDGALLPVEDEGVPADGDHRAALHHAAPAT